MGKHSTTVGRLLELYQDSSAAHIRPPRAVDEDGFLIMNIVAEIPPERSLQDTVSDRRTGLDYAAWCIGETLAALGGRDLLVEVYWLVMEEGGAKAASWLDHRWNFVSINGRPVWIA